MQGARCATVVRTRCGSSRSQTARAPSSCSTAAAREPDHGSVGGHRPLPGTKALVRDLWKKADVALSPFALRPRWNRTVL